VCTRSINSCASCCLRPICFPAGVTRGSSTVRRLNVTHGHLERGETLYVSGQRCSALYALRSGCVKDVLTKRNGVEALVQFCLPGEAVGLGCLAAGRARSSVIAVAASRYCKISWASFQALAREVPEVAYELVRLLAATVTATHELVASVLKQEALARVAELLLDVSARLQRSGLDGSHFRLGLSRRDIASYLGVTIETVSRCFTELDRRRLIVVRGKDLRLLRPADLHLLAGDG